jgi:hypothetical protein
VDIFGLNIFGLRVTPTSTDLVSSLMPVTVDPPFRVYRDRLTALSHGLALWNPDPPKRNLGGNTYLTEKIYDKVSIGDVGYLFKGTFIRLFNVMLPWDHPLNRTIGYPEPYEPLDFGPFDNTIGDFFNRVEHYSHTVSGEENAYNMMARSPEE